MKDVYEDENQMMAEMLDGATPSAPRSGKGPQGDPATKSAVTQPEGWPVLQNAGEIRQAVVDAVLLHGTWDTRMEPLSESEAAWWTEFAARVAEGVVQRFDIAEAPAAKDEASIRASEREAVLSEVNAAAEKLLGGEVDHGEYITTGSIQSDRENGWFVTEGNGTESFREGPLTEALGISPSPNPNPTN